MTEETTLLDDGWSYGRKNFASVGFSNSVSPSVIDKRENTRSDWRASFYNAGLTHSSASGLGALGQINAYFRQKAETEKAMNAMHGVSVADTIRSQLAPGQEVRLLVELETGRVRLVRAGDSYISDPQHKPFEIRRAGPDGGICRGDELAEVTRFLVTNRKGEKEWLVLEERTESSRRDSDAPARSPSADVRPRGNRKQREEP